MTQARTAVTVLAALTYLNDDLDRLTSATEPLGGVNDETFTYDAVGNRLRRDGEVADSTFNGANRLTEDAGFCYGYGLNGNLATKTAKVAKRAGLLPPYLIPAPHTQYYPTGLGAWGPRDRIPPLSPCSQRYTLSG